METDLKKNPVQFISPNSDIAMCTNGKCVRKENCKRYLKEGTVGLYYIIDHRGKNLKCKDFLNK